MGFQGLARQTSSLQEPSVEDAVEKTYRVKVTGLPAMTSTAAGYHFRIRPDADGWSWQTMDTAGAIKAGGQAPTKAIAAALVIRTIARAMTAEAAPKA